jgi:hypothetical protein
MGLLLQLLLEGLKACRVVSVKRNYVILFRQMATRFGRRDHHQAIVTKVLKIKCSGVQIMLVVWDRI